MSVSTEMPRKKIVVLDFGSQYAHLIAKRFRLMGWYSEIALPSTSLDTFTNAAGIVFSGGPSSVYEDDIPEFNEDILTLDIPILGLCYGHQLMAQKYGGKVENTGKGEFGIATLSTKGCPESPLFKGIAETTQVWMSHQDTVTVMGEGFETVGSTAMCKNAALQNLAKKRFSLQCHVEVKDTPEGNKILANFAEYCGMEKNWSQDTVLETILENIKTDSKDRKVLLFLSGGVDSTVAFALLNKALGNDRVLGLHIDNGFMRKNESKKIEKLYKERGFTNFIVEDASESFLNAIKGLTDPQKKRMAVGENFITVRNEVTERLKFNEDEWLLAQGTLYPDIIESGGTKNSKVIKTHHNRVDGIQALIAKGLIIEPLKDLYKDEVRLIGKKLGLPDEMVMRHPFPGPGLSINVLCNDGQLSAEDEKDIQKTSESVKNIDLSGIFSKKPESYILPVKSVGVQGDFRTYRFPAVLAFGSSGSAKETIAALPDWDSIESASSFITNSTHDVNRTVIELYNKGGCTLQQGYCDRPRLDQTREADAIVLEELHSSGWYGKIFQHLTINLPYAKEAGHCAIVLRPVVSEDVMTARFAHLDRQLLETILEKLKKLEFIDAIFYDVTNKPPATFGWE